MPKSSNSTSRRLSKSGALALTSRKSDAGKPNIKSEKLHLSCLASRSCIFCRNQESGRSLSENHHRLSSNIYSLLDRWGAWAAAECSGVDWKPIAAGFQGLIPYGKKSRSQCDDDEGIAIDGCVSHLKKYKPDEYELIIAHFVIGISLRSIAKKRRCSDGKIRGELQSAMGFIEGIMCII